MIATRPDHHFGGSRAHPDAKKRPPLALNAPGETSMTNGNGSPPEAGPPPQLNVLAQ